MSAPFNKVKRKTEDAFESLINLLKGTGLDGVAFFKTFSLSQLSLPRLEIMATKAEAERMGDIMTGNFLVEVMLVVASHAEDTTRGEHANRVATVEDIIMRDDVVTSINNLPDLSDYTAFENGWKPLTSEDTTDGVEVRTEIIGTMYCRPSTSEYMGS